MNDDECILINVVELIFSALKHIKFLTFVNLICYYMVKLTTYIMMTKFFIIVYKETHHETKKSKLKFVLMRSY